MKTVTITKEKSHVEQLMSQLPIAKHFEGGLTSALDDAKANKGKTVALILKLAVIGAIGYFSWIYILPAVFEMLGKFVAVAATGLAIVGLIFILPAIFKWMGVMARKIKKAAINSDPFLEMEKQEISMIANQKQARNAHGHINALENDMHLEAQANEKQAEKYQTKILTNQGKAEEMRARMKTLETAHGPSKAKGMDDYVNTNAKLLKLLSESSRVSARLEQAQNFVRKYGARAAIMKKVGHKLTMVETIMDNKVLDFRATIEILKKDYEFASKAREATDAAKSAMLFDKSWELEYALDAVTTTIAHDIAQTSGNFKDINLLTANFDMDSDEMFANLDKLAEQIQTGQNATPVAKDYNRVDYDLTQDDKLQSGTFGDLY